MNDTYTEVSETSWLSRIGNAFKGMILGAILVVLSIALLWWNEGRSVKQYKSLKEGQGAVVSASATPIDKTLEGSLVYITGLATSSSELNDTEFGINERLIKLDRDVEIYQWKETVRTKTEKNLGGSERKVKTYSYSKEWDDNLINSQKFKKSAEHRNPTLMKYNKYSRVADTVTVGDYSLSPALKSRFKTQLYPNLKDVLNHDSVPKGATINEQYLYIGNDEADPQIGDIKITWSFAKDTDVSVVAKQQDAKLIGYQTKAGNKIEILKEGNIGVDQIFEDAQSSNSILTWCLRGAGLFICFIGFCLITSPLSVIADVVPFIGNLVGAGTALVSFIISVVLSFFTIAVAWFAYRPILSICLILAATASIYIIKLKMPKKAQQVCTDNG